MLGREKAKGGVSQTFDGVGRDALASAATASPVCDGSLHLAVSFCPGTVSCPLQRLQLASARLSPLTMGNSASSGRGHHEETVDFGYLTPQGIYTGPRDWNQTIVTQLIIDRKLAPFYRPLEDYDESWDDDQILAARKEPPEPEGGESSRADSVSSVSAKGHAKRPSAAKEPVRHPEAAIYRGAVECPICFLVRLDVSMFMCFALFMQVHGRVVLSTQHQPFTMLRPSYMHGVLRTDQESRTNDHACCLRARSLSILRPGELWCCLHASTVAGWAWERGGGTSAIALRP